MLQGQIAKATVRTSFVLGLRLVVQAGTLLLVTRLLGPGQFGAFAGIASLAIMLGTLSTFGTHLVLLGEMSQSPQRREKVLLYAIPITLLCGALLLGVYGLICLFLLEVKDFPLHLLLFIGGTELLLQPLFGLMTTEHHALGRVAHAQLLQMLPMALRLLVAGLVFVLQVSQPLTAYTVGYVMASVLALAYGAHALPEHWPAWHEWRLPCRDEYKNALGYVAINITKAGPAELDKTLALQLLPHGAAGVYAAGARVVGAITLPVTAMTLSALPRLFRDGHKASGRHLVVWMYGIALAYSVFLAGALWFVAPVFNLVFGMQYRGIGDVIRLLCLAIPGMALRLVAGNVLMALGNPWMRVEFEVAGLTILVFASVVLVGHHRASGMPLALACAEWSMAVIGAWLVTRVKMRG